MKNLLIAGIGGVGGYFGGVLSKYYEDKDELAVYFLARGENADVISEHGLQVKDGDELFLTRPRKVYTRLDTAQKMDYILVCTKSYHLEELIPQLQLCITDNTVIVPLLNGIEPYLNLKKAFPKHLVAKACTYLVSQQTHPGKIDNKGEIKKIYFGSSQNSDFRLIQLQNYLAKAKINSSLADNIDSIVWEKFIFIAAIATATTYFNTTIGEIADKPERRDSLIKLIDEAACLAEKFSINLPNNIRDLTLSKIEQMPFSATSSMHRDFLAGKPAELDNLTGFVVRQANLHGFTATTFSEMYEVLNHQLTKH